MPVIHHHMPLQYSLGAGVRRTESPCIPLARAWGAEYTATEDAPLLDLSQGVPGAPPHASYLDALGSVSATPEAAKYGPILGEDALRAALAAELSLMYKADITAHDMAITAGCNMAFYSVLTALTTPAENAVILPLPSYFNHTMTLSLCDVKAEYIPCDTGDFTPSLGAARELLEQEKQQQQPQPRIAAILLTSPNNPTGAVYTAQQLESWLALAREFHVPLILDETYRDFAAPHTLFNDHAWRDSLVSLGSFSKQYRIPGHRLGSITAAPELLEAVATVLDCMQICPPRPPQLALAPLLPSLRGDLAQSAAALKARLAAFADAVGSVPGWKVKCSGGFYAYVEFPEYAGGRYTSSEMSQMLAAQCGVLTLPGSFFTPDGKSQNSQSIADHPIHQDRWIRFAVANVSDEVVASLAPRLRKLNTMMGVVR